MGKGVPLRPIHRLKLQVLEEPSSIVVVSSWSVIVTLVTD